MFATFDLEFDVVKTHYPRKDFNFQTEIYFRTLIRIIGICRLVSGVTPLLDVFDTKFVDVVAHGSKLHRSHLCVIAVVVMTVEIVIIDVVVAIPVMCITIEVI